MKAECEKSLFDDLMQVETPSSSALAETDFSRSVMSQAQCSVADFQENIRLITEISESLSGRESLEEVDGQSIFKLSSSLLRAWKMLRMPLQTAQSNAKSRLLSPTFTSVADSICTVETARNDAFLRVCIPAFLPTPDRRKGEWYSKRQSQFQKEIACVLAEKLNGYQLQVDASELRNQPLFMVFRRHLPSGQTRNFLDNNNVECGVITNTICSAFDLSDGYQNMNFIYLTIPSEHETTFEIILCDKGHLPRWI